MGLLHLAGQHSMYVRLVSYKLFATENRFTYSWPKRIFYKHNEEI